MATKPEVRPEPFFRSVGAPCERRLLSHVDGEHRFYLEEDGRVGVYDNSGTRHYLAAARIRIGVRGGADIPIATDSGETYWTPEPAAGALALVKALAGIGYHPGLDTSRASALVELLKYDGHP